MRDESVSDDGWYGKIPASGDFVHRRVSREWIAHWDKWLRHGMAAMSQLPDKAQREFDAAPIWNFAIPSGVGGGAVRLGCVAPSHDRVGRRYPVGSVRTVPLRDYQPRILETAADYYRLSGAALLAALRHGCNAHTLDEALLRASAALRIDAAEAPTSGSNDILAVLNSGRPEGSMGVLAIVGLAWPELPRYFNPGSHTSYWWTNQADGAPLQTYLHGGSLNSTLFSRLFVSGPASLRAFS